MREDPIQPEKQADGWVFAWLSLPPGCAAFWNDVAENLAGRGLQLAALIQHDCEQERSQLRFPNIAGDIYSTVGLGLRFADFIHTKHSHLASKVAHQCTQRDRCYWYDKPIHGPLIDLAARGAAILEYILAPAFDGCPPVAGIVWNGSGSGAHAVATMLADRRVGTCYAERGPITPSIFIDRLGVNGLSERVRDPNWIERWKSCAQPNEYEVEKGREIAQHLSGRRAQNWSPREPWKLGGIDHATNTVSPPGDHSESHKETTSALGVDQPSAWCGEVAYFGCLEPHAIFADQQTCANAGLPFGDSYRAAEHLMRACAQAGIADRTTLKPHPLDNQPERYAWICRSLGGRVSRAIDVYNAVECGAAIVTTSESVAWLASMLGGRVLSLGLTPLGIAGAIEEPAAELCADQDPSPSNANLRNAIQNALRRVTSLKPKELMQRQQTAWACLAKLAPVMCTRDAQLQRLGLSSPDTAAETILQTCGHQPVEGKSVSATNGTPDAEYAVASLLRSAESLGLRSSGTCRSSTTKTITTTSSVAARPVLC